MAFQDPYRNHNFLGTFANDAAATAWVLATKWDSTNDGLGVPQDGVWFYRTTDNVFVGRMNGLWVPITGSVAITGNGEIYVDIVDGSDVTGDGSIGKPYQTFQFACASVLTVNLGDFTTPVKFVLAPGTYAGAVANLPNRQFISVTGSMYALTMQQYVEVDGAIPAILANYPRYVMFSTDTPLQSYFGTGASHFQVKRVNAAIGGPPSPSLLMFKDLVLTTGKILIDPSGSANPNENTGDWRVFFDGCMQQPLSTIYLFGSYEAPSNDLNRLDLFANTSILGIGPGATRLKLRGVVGLGDIVGTNLKMDVSYLLDYNDVAYFGSIGGSPYAYVGIQSSEINSGTFKAFGWNGATPAAPDPIKGDSNCLKRFIDETFTFTNVTSSTEVRSWAVHSDNMEYAVDWPSDSTLIVPRGDNDVQSGINLLATYARAAALLPGGSALSATNRAVVLVPPGGYDLNLVQLLLTHEYVDLVGLVEGDHTVVDQISPHADIYSRTAGPGAVVIQTAGDVRLFNLRIRDTLGGQPALDVQNNTTASQYVNLYFSSTGAVAVGSSVGFAILGVWDGVQSKKGLLVGAFDGYAENCSGGDYSFGGNNAGAAVFSGTCRRCVGGDCSFGSSDFAASAGTCSGTAIECTGRDYSFGYSHDAVGLFSGEAEKCVADAESFGSSYNSDGTFTGTAVDCDAGIKSFGSSHDGDGVFNGVATRCTAQGDSFGCTDGLGLVGFCGGILTDCRSLTQSFGFATAPLAIATCSAHLHGCAASHNSFGNSENGDAIFSGDAVDCTVGDQSFGFSSANGPAGSVLCSGTATNCGAGANSFGCGQGTQIDPVTCSGTFYQCRAGNYSFGYNLGTAGIAGFSGKATLCEAGTNSFGSSDGLVGTFTGEAYDCTAGDFSFGFSMDADGLFSGVAKRCVAGSDSFGVTGDTTTTFTGSVTAPAVLEDCVAGARAFAAAIGVAPGASSADFLGTAYRCTATSHAFGYALSGLAGCDGDLESCISGDHSFGSAIDASGGFTGTATDCVSGDASFGYSEQQNATCSGTVERCTSGGLCFGATGDGANPVGGDATFSGVAIECQGLSPAGCGCFGCAFNVGGPPVVATVSGQMYRCNTVGDYAFGVSVSGSVDITAAAVFEDCVADKAPPVLASGSFGYSFADDVLFAGVARRCRSGEKSFGVTHAGGNVKTATFSGTAYDCIAGDTSFGVCSTAGLKAEVTGSLYRCTAGDNSFGFDFGTAGWCDGAYLENCTGGPSSFSSGAGGVKDSTLIRCKCIQRDDHPILLDAGTKLIDCVFSAQSHVLVVTDDTRVPNVYGCTLYSSNPDPVVFAAAPQTIQMAHCRMNMDIDVSVTNLIVDGYNVLDALIEEF